MPPPHIMRPPHFSEQGKIENLSEQSPPPKKKIYPLHICLASDIIIMPGTVSLPFALFFLNYLSYIFMCLCTIFMDDNKPLCYGCYVILRYVTLL